MFKEKLSLSLPTDVQLCVVLDSELLGRRYITQQKPRDTAIYDHRYLVRTNPKPGHIRLCSDKSRCDWKVVSDTSRQGDTWSYLELYKWFRLNSYNRTCLSKIVSFIWTTKPFIFLSTTTFRLIQTSGNNTQIWQVPMLYVQFLSSWWWAEKPLETCTALTTIKNIV
jgi:hypothetical protein